MKVFKDELQGKRVVWVADGRYGTFSVAEILGEESVAEFKVRLAGYTPINSQATKVGALR